ncbi:hypothetical protein CLV63_105169 [Murinocardiopsis flavida]|uniref:Uncharacterized protein n=1 Tax=Murinocardiopsis flavida TaxID=645275 RepID=A0A2P8DMR4_9ACTN|nr:hypothetical protein [Murinocardiopsis flavida]PSK98495.1 hypothetical protein CLV63_105169 [Murinocardiopsis flavida]
MAENPWAWQDGRNPYTWTPFQVLDLPPDTAGRAAIDAHVRKRRGRVARAPERYPVFGRIPTVADVNEAAEQIRDPEARLLAELRTHRPERADAAERVAVPAPPEIPAPEPVVRADALYRLVPPPAPRHFERLWPHGG